MVSPNIDKNIDPEELKVPPRGSKIVRIICEKSEYLKLVENNDKFKTFLDQQIKDHPELYPNEINKGYALYGKTRCSKKLDNLQFRRIRINSSKEIFNIYPSFVMPYLTSYTYDVEKALILRKHDVPYSTLTYIGGHNDMFWQRAEKAFNRCSVTGTTVKKTKSFLKTLLPMKNNQDSKKEKYISQ